MLIPGYNYSKRCLNPTISHMLEKTKTLRNNHWKNSSDKLTAVKFMGSIGFQDIELVLVCHNEVKVSIIMNIFGIKPNEEAGKTTQQ